MTLDRLAPLLTAILCLALGVHVIWSVGPWRLLVPQEACVAAVYDVVSGELVCEPR